jgi:hypothetical protein
MGRSIQCTLQGLLQGSRRSGSHPTLPNQQLHLSLLVGCPSSLKPVASGIKKTRKLVRTLVGELVIFPVRFRILSVMLGMGHKRRVRPCLLFSFSALATRLLPFTVTRPVTIQEISIALESRDTKVGVGRELTNFNLSSVRTFEE